jgi:hypothetical protein
LSPFIAFCRIAFAVFMQWGKNGRGVTRILMFFLAPAGANVSQHAHQSFPSRRLGVVRKPSLGSLISTNPGVSSSGISHVLLDDEQD